MLLHGFHVVMSRLRRSPGSVTELYLDMNRQDARMGQLQKLAAQHDLRAKMVEGVRLDRLCRHKRHQGVVAFAEADFEPVSLEDLLDDIEGPALLLVLDGVTDPRNLGACLRAADGAGAHGVIAPKDHACTLTDVAVQTASGAAESVPYVMVTNLARAMDTLNDAGIWTIGTADEADQTLFDADIPESVAWVLGAEGKGLRRLTRERCDALVRIPMGGAVSSLNVSVASGIALYDSVRRRAAATRAAP
ncbi:MAG: 23S rRNA (guanosine(2251)-2'-O)-methyltransferase RlmB [Burkholderiaceae bacterium]